MRRLTLAILGSAITMFTVRFSSVEVPRIRIGGRQTIETLINEEALVLARYLRSEKKEWAPRLPSRTRLV